MKAQLIEFIFSMRWLWIIAIIVFRNIVKRHQDIQQVKNNIERDRLIKETVYNEDDIIKHLDHIINEALDEYVLLNIVPKNIYYINSKLENEITAWLAEEIPNRISSTLIRHLSFIYNENYLGDYLGTHIYLIVVDYVLNFNVNNSDEANKK